MIKCSCILFYSILGGGVVKTRTYSGRQMGPLHSPQILIPYKLGHSRRPVASTKETIFPRGISLIELI